MGVVASEENPDLGGGLSESTSLGDVRADPCAIIVILVYSTHDRGHSAAAGVPTLAQSNGAEGAGERGALVLMSTGTACAGGGAMGGPRAKPRT